MSKSVPRLVRRGDTFYFRAAIPRKLWMQLGSRELKASLRTGDPSLAKLRGRALSSDTDLLFTRLGHMPASTGAIDERVRDYFQQALNKALALALELPDNPGCDLSTEVEMLSRDVAEMRSQLVQHTYPEPVQSDARALLDAVNGSHHPDLEVFQYACNVVLRAKLENTRILAARLSGEYDATAPRDPLFHGVTATLPPSPGEIAPPTTSHTLASVSERFFEHKAKHWVTKTAADVKRVLKLASDVIGGEKPMRSIDIDDVKAVRDVLAKLPPNFMKFGTKKGLTPTQAAQANTEGKSLSLKTQDKYFTMFRQLLLWSMDEGYLDKMPGQGVKVAGVGSANPAEQRDPYSLDQLRAIFSSPLYTGHKSEQCRHKAGQMVIRDGKFWVPLIALYSGMRMGEIVQLLTSDLKQDNGVWYFDVNEAEGKTLKTASSKRRVPVHHMLIALGLLSHSAQKRMFPDIEPGKDGYSSHNFSKWWGRYARQIGVKSPKVTFHSFRHNFKDALQTAEVSENIAKALMGHTDKSVHGQYGSGAPLSVLKANLDKVAYNLDLNIIGIGQPSGML